MTDTWRPLALGYDPQNPPEKFYLISPEGKHLHFPQSDNPEKPLCGLHSGLGWESISERWEELLPLCQRCESQQGRK